MSYPDGCYLTGQFLSGAQDEPQHQRAYKRFFRCTLTNPCRSRQTDITALISGKGRTHTEHQLLLKRTSPWLVWIVLEAAETHIV